MSIVSFNHIRIGHSQQLVATAVSIVYYIAIIVLIKVYIEASAKLITKTTLIGYKVKNTSGSTYLGAMIRALNNELKTKLTKMGSVNYDVIKNTGELIACRFSSFFGCLLMIALHGLLFIVVIGIITLQSFMQGKFHITDELFIKMNVKFIYIKLYILNHFFSKYFCV